MTFTQHYDSPLGSILLTADEMGLTGLWFDGQKHFARGLPAQHTEQDTPVLLEAKRWLDVYFTGREPDFLPALHPMGSAFRRRVWDLLLRVPYGQTVTYGQLAQQLARRGAEAELLEFDSGEAFLAAEKERRFTAAFLDIYMEGMTGMEAARTLRKTDADCLLVFTTTSTDHALEGFQVRALHYLVKPFAEAEIDALTDELLARVPQPERFMELRVEGGEIRLRYRDIIRAEHFAHVIYVHPTAGKTLATRQSFKAFTAPLKEDPRFFVCGRGVIVNLEHAEDFEDAAFLMEDGSRVFVSQELQKSARQSFMEYLLQRRHMV